MNRQRIGGWAALLNAGVAVGNLAVIFGVLGAAVMADPGKVVALVMTRPAPLFWLEFFKIMAALAMIVIVAEFHRRLDKQNKQKAQRLRLVTFCGVVSILFLLLAGLIGAFAILQANQSLRSDWLPSGATYTGFTRLINQLGLAALFANGLWLAGINWLAGKDHAMPAGLRTVSWLLAITNLLAFALSPIALLSLILGLIWSLWLGRWWL